MSLSCSAWKDHWPDFVAEAVNLERETSCSVPSTVHQCSPFAASVPRKERRSASRKRKTCSRRTRLLSGRGRGDPADAARRGLSGTRRGNIVIIVAPLGGDVGSGCSNIVTYDRRSLLVLVSRHPTMRLQPSPLVPFTLDLGIDSGESAPRGEGVVGQ